MARSRSPYYAGAFVDLPDAPAPPPERNQISEADLFRGYSGLVDRRRFDQLTNETVRRRLTAAYGPTAADGVASREDPRDPDVVASPALRR